MIDTSNTFYPTFYRTYSRVLPDGTRESWQNVKERVFQQGLAHIGRLSDREIQLLQEQFDLQRAFPSGRVLWVGGTEWSTAPEHYAGLYNCTSTNIQDWQSFGLLMDLAMQGCGTGAVLEPQYIGKLPPICNQLHVEVEGVPGEVPPPQRAEKTLIDRLAAREFRVVVGDSREGWVSAYQWLLEKAADTDYTESLGFAGELKIVVDVRHVRPTGERLKGFGGVANPTKLPQLFERCAQILNGALGRQLSELECSLLIDEAAAVVVAGNLRRCLPENALVHTAKGLIPLKDVQPGDLVQTPLGFRKVVYKFNQGVQNVYELKTNGAIPRATLNHRYAVLNDATGGYSWKQVFQLEPEDRLLHNQTILGGSTTALPEDFTANRPKNSHTAKDIKVPQLTPEVAWLIGFTHGDGYVSLGTNKHNKSYGNITWATDETIADEIELKLNRALQQFGVTAKRQTLAYEKTNRFFCSSIRLTEYFYQHIKQPKTSIQIPDFILQGHIETRAAYLAGLMDSDGAANNRPPHLVTTVYQDFIRQASAVLSSLGITGRISTTPPQKKNWQPKWNLDIPAFKHEYNRLIAPHSVKGELKIGLKMYGFTIPGKMMRETYAYTDMQGMGFQGNRKVDSNYERYRSQSEVEMDIPVTFKELGSVDVMQTYDIEVEDAHCFYCDGYLTHNSAGIRQFPGESPLYKLDLWQQGEDGKWQIDPDRAALTMANHTRVFHSKPNRETCVDAVRQQYYSGEGAIQYAPEAIARSNADIIEATFKEVFIGTYEIEGYTAAFDLLRDLLPEAPDKELHHRLQRYGTNPCGEINGSDFFCNLGEVHLNNIDPSDREGQEKAFQAASISVAALLYHRFVEPRYRYSREVDPIVGVSFTGLFDFFVHAFGVDWLRWWEAGRPETQEGLDFKNKEREYLEWWRRIVFDTVAQFCNRHGLKRPNRVTCVQPSGTKSLLTGASPGWHPPKSSHFLRRITFRKNDPVARACYRYGYNIMPAHSDRDENGNLLDDPFDERCGEWLVEIPVATSWHDLPGAEDIKIENFSALAQFDFAMQVQKYYTTHNTSATIELREPEIEALGDRIYRSIQQEEGYISFALLPRFDSYQAFPRLPFEPISKSKYEQLEREVEARREKDSFFDLLLEEDRKLGATEQSPEACEGMKCQL